VISIPRDLLREGTNVLAASVHNVNVTSTDVSFIPTLELVRRGEPPPADEFRRGDTDGTGRVDITDALVIFNFLFLGGRAPACRDTADTDDDGAIILTDGIVILNVIFLGSGSIAAPGFTACGPDTTPASPPFPPCEYDACP
jgi:hypothetical protein